MQQPSLFNFFSAPSDSENAFSHSHTQPPSSEAANFLDNSAERERKRKSTKQKAKKLTKKSKPTSESAEEQEIDNELEGIEEEEEEEEEEDSITRTQKDPWQDVGSEDEMDAPLPNERVDKNGNLRSVLRKGKRASFVVSSEEEEEASDFDYRTVPESAFQREEEEEEEVDDSLSGEPFTMPFERYEEIKPMCKRTCLAMLDELHKNDKGYGAGVIKPRFARMLEWICEAAHLPFPAYTYLRYNPFTRQHVPSHVTIQIHDFSSLLVSLGYLEIRTRNPAPAFQEEEEPPTQDLTFPPEDPFGLRSLYQRLSLSHQAAYVDTAEERQSFNEASQGSLNLVAMNMKANQIQEAVRTGDAFIIQKAKYWMSESQNTQLYPTTIEGRTAYEEWVISEANKFMTAVHYLHKDSSMICTRWVKPNGEWNFYTKSPRGMKDLFQGINIHVIDQERQKLRHLVENTFDPSTAVLPKEAVKLMKKDPETQTYKLPPLSAFKEQLLQENLFDFWLAHPMHSRREAIVFNPRPPNHPEACDDSRFLNSWKGMGKGFSRDDVKEEKDWNLLIPILNHLRWSLCENDAQYIHLIAFISHLFKHPWIKMETTPSFHGAQGSGKSLFWTLIGRMIGEAHFTAITNMIDLTGEFTASMVEKILLFIDEVVFKGDKEANVMKNLQTGKWQRVRMMFQNPTYQESFLNFVLAFNKLEWTAIFGAKQRRNLYLSSYIEELLKTEMYKELRTNPEDKAADPSRYFSFLESVCLFKGGKALKVFANFLYTLPLENYNPRALPASFKAWEVATLSLHPVHRWWYDCLCNGFMNVMLPQESKKARSCRDEDVGDAYSVVGDEENIENYLPNTIHLPRSVPIWPKKIYSMFVYRGYLSKFPNGGDKNIKEEDFLHELKILCPEIDTEMVKDNPFAAGANKKVCFPIVETCRLLWKKQYPAIPFQHEMPYKTVAAVFENRLKAASDYELLNPFPVNFYGYNIRALIESKGFDNMIRDTVSAKPDSMLETDKINQHSEDLMDKLIAKKRTHEHRATHIATTNKDNALSTLINPYGTVKDWEKMSRVSVLALVKHVHKKINDPLTDIIVEQHLLDRGNKRFRHYVGPYLTEQQVTNEYLASITEKQHKSACKALYRLKDKLLKVNEQGEFIHRETANLFQRVAFDE
jgi:hypothetical protein